MTRIDKILDGPLLAAFVSRRFDAAQVESRLTALLHMREDEWDWAPIEAARAVGAALRAEAPERVRSAALLWAERTVDGALPSTTLRQRLCAIMPVSALPGRTTLCDVGAEEFEALVRGSFASADGALSATLLDWCEFGTREALHRLTEAPGLKPERLSISSPGARAERIYEVIARAHRGDVVAEVRALIRPGHYGLTTAGARHLARRLAVDPATLSPGLDCDRGSRMDLHAEEHRPLVDLLAQRADLRELLVEAIAAYCDAAWIPKQLLPDLFARVPWSEHASAPPAWFVGRLGSLLFTQNAKRATCKSEKTDAAAAKAFGKKVTELTTKVGAGPQLPEDPNAALHDAVKDYKRADVRLLLAHGARPDGHPEGAVTALQFHAGADPEVVRLMIAAGADVQRRDERGLTVLDVIAALDASHPRLASAELLLAAGARGDGYGGASQLHHAARKGNTALCELLLAHGADPNAVAGPGSYAGKTPLELARELGEAGIAAVAVLERA
jgi:hypothetical protein